MALNKVTLINTPKRTVIKYVVTGDSMGETDTITLASLVSPGQSVQGTPEVAIIALITSTNTPTTCTLTRNAVPIFKTYGTFDHQFVRDGSYAIKEQATSDITVAVTGDGTYIIELRKEDGYTFGPELATIGI